MSHWKMLCIFEVLLSAVFYYLNVRMGEQLQMTHGIQATLADSYVLADFKCGGVEGIKAMAVVPLYLWYLMTVTAREGETGYVLARRSRIHIWNSLVRKNLFGAFLFTTGVWAAVGLCGAFKYRPVCSWNEMNSSYWAAAGEVLGREVSVLTVGAAYWFVTFLTLFLSGLLFLLCLWGFSQRLMGWIVCMGLCFVEDSGRLQVPILYSRFTIAFGNWEKNFPWPGMLTAACALAVSLYFAGAVLGRKKEFL